MERSKGLQTVSAEAKYHRWSQQKPNMADSLDRKQKFFGTSLHPVDSAVVEEFNYHINPIYLDRKTKANSVEQIRLFLRAI